MRKVGLLLLLVVLFSISGCGGKASVTSTPVKTSGAESAVPTKPPTKAPVVTPTETPTQAPTATSTAVPTSTPSASPTPKATAKPQPFVLKSPAFPNGGAIPDRFASCGHPNVSPALEWSGVPKGAKSLVLCVMDKVYLVWKDVPKGTAFAHWAVYNIPVDYKGLKENQPKSTHLQDGILQCKGGYFGPCPPKGEKHFYFFTLYALDETLSVPPEQGRDLCFALGGLMPFKARPGDKEVIQKLEQALKGHVIASTTIQGTYTRK